MTPVVPVEALPAEALPLPACLRCGSPGQVPVRPHGIAYCAACYVAELAVTVDTGDAGLA